MRGLRGGEGCHDKQESYQSSQHREGGWRERKEKFILQLPRLISPERGKPGKSRLRTGERLRFFPS